MRLATSGKVPAAATTPVSRVKQRQGRQVLEILGQAGAWVPFDGEGDPGGQARRRVLAQVPAASPVVAVIGLGLGHVLHAIDEVSPDAHVVALELTPALAALSASVPSAKERNASGRLTIAVAPAFETLGTATARAALAQAGAALPLVISPALTACCPDAIDGARTVLRQRLFEAKANEDARRANAGRYLLNTLRNLSAIEHEGDVASLANCFAGTPAVVLAAGPTLDDTIADLREAAARAVIIAVDTSLKPLLKAGITPDLVVAMDPTEQNARHLYDIPDLPGTWLVAEPSVNPAILSAFPGRSFLLSLGFDPWPWIAQSGTSRGRLRAWGSVATTAYDLALALGCNPIGLAGLDFSFPGGQPYCRNTEYEHDWADAAGWGNSLEAIWHGWTHRWRDVTEVDVNGRPVLTAPHLVAFRDWVRKDIERVAVERTVFNAGGGILTGPSVERGSLRDRIPHGFDARNAVPARLRNAHVPPDCGAALCEARRKLIESLNIDGGELASESPVHQWIRFAPTTTVGDIRKALDEPADVTPRRIAGPHVTPEQTARLRKMLAGESSTPVGSLADSLTQAVEICGDLLGSAPTSVGGYSPLLGEGIGAKLVPASALVDWSGPAYALVRRLEASLASIPADAGVPSFRRGLAEPLSGNTGSRARAPQAAHVAVARETALALALEEPGVAADALRAIDPALAPGELECEISIGPGIRARASLRHSDLGRVLTGRLAGACDAGQTEIAAGQVTLQFAERGDGPGVVRFLARDSWSVAPRVLHSPEFGSALFGLTLDGQSAVLNPLVGISSVRVREDGGFEPMPAWPHPIIGEIPTLSGGWVAWSNVAATPLLMRRSSTAVNLVQPAPFRPNRVIDWDGQFLCTAHDGGLWLWNPGTEPRKVADAPPALSLLKTSSGVRLDPVVRSAEGYTTRTRLDHAWMWRAGVDLERLALGIAGPCWSVAASGGWTARAYPHDDLVTLTHESGRVVDLACYYPVTLAWAGRSLIVLSSTSGTILLFENLRDALAERPRGAA